MARSHCNKRSKSWPSTESTWDKTLFPVKQLKQKNYIFFKCGGCKYKSMRRFNVTRHYERIHWRVRQRICCDNVFQTKGEYYLHCAQVHNKKDWHNVIFTKKYGINVGSRSKSVRKEIDAEEHKFSFQQRQYNTRQFLRNLKKDKKSFISLEDTHLTEFDPEDVPLINFLEDPSLMRIFMDKSFDSIHSKTVEIDSPKPIGIDAMTQSSDEEQDTVVKAQPKNQSNILNEISDSRMIDNVESSRSSVMELPTKKLILNRFLSNKYQEYRVPLLAIENNENLINRTKKDKALQNVAKSIFPISRMDKENISQPQSEVKQKIKVNIDDNIPLPVMTYMHREFLSSIDFDNI